MERILAWLVFQEGWRPWGLTWGWPMVFRYVTINNTIKYIGIDDFGPVKRCALSASDSWLFMIWTAFLSLLHSKGIAFCYILHCCKAWEYLKLYSTVFLFQKLYCNTAIRKDRKWKLLLRKYCFFLVWGTLNVCGQLCPSFSWLHLFHMLFLQGTIYNDALMSCCCGLLEVCRMAREIRIRNGEVW